MSAGIRCEYVQKILQGWNWSARKSPVSLSGLIGLAPRIVDPTQRDQTRQSL